MSSPRLKVGFDIGGTKTEVVLVRIEKDGPAVISSQRHATERDLGYEHILKVMKDLLVSELAKNHFHMSDIESIGLAMPGSVDPNSGQMILGNTRVLENRDIKKDFARALNTQTPILTENDANCFALAEFHLGAGKKYKNIVGIILGTGVGSGVIIDGKILKGRRGTAGEIGHTFFKKREKPCYCGQQDCAELYLSGPGFEAYHFEKTREKKSLKDIFQDDGYLGIYKKDLAHFLARVTNTLDPDAFILGGGISLEKRLYENIGELMVPELFFKDKPPLVLQHGISDSAGGIGAALLTYDA